MRWSRHLHYHDASRPYTLKLASADSTGVIHVWNVSSSVIRSELVLQGHKSVLGESTSFLRSHPSNICLTFLLGFVNRISRKFSSIRSTDSLYRQCFYKWSFKDMVQIFPNFRLSLDGLQRLLSSSALGSIWPCSSGSLERRPRNSRLEEGFLERMSWQNFWFFSRALHGNLDCL